MPTFAVREQGRLGPKRIQFTLARGADWEGAPQFPGTAHLRIDFEQRRRPSSSTMLCHWQKPTRLHSGLMNTDLSNHAIGPLHAHRPIA